MRDFFMLFSPYILFLFFIFVFSVCVYRNTKIFHFLPINITVYVKNYPFKPPATVLLIIVSWKTTKMTSTGNTDINNPANKDGKSIS